MIRHACYVVCDRCNGRPAQISTDGAGSARLIARGEGYIKTPMGEDVCPPCAGKEWDGVRWRWPAAVSGGSTSNPAEGTAQNDPSPLEGP